MFNPGFSGVYYKDYILLGCKALLTVPLTLISWLAFSSTLKREAIYSCETSELHGVTAKKNTLFVITNIIPLKASSYIFFQISYHK
jgi:hypothetical protein